MSPVRRPGPFKVRKLRSVHTKIDHLEVFFGRNKSSWPNGEFKIFGDPLRLFVHPMTRQIFRYIVGRTAWTNWNLVITLAWCLFWAMANDFNEAEMNMQNCPLTYFHMLVFFRYWIWWGLFFLSLFWHKSERLWQKLDNPDMLIILLSECKASIMITLGICHL